MATNNIFEVLSDASDEEEQKEMKKSENKKKKQVVKEKEEKHTEFAKKLAISIRKSIT